MILIVATSHAAENSAKQALIACIAEKIAEICQKDGYVVDSAVKYIWDSIWLAWLAQKTYN